MVFHTVCSETMKSVPRSCENGGPKDSPLGREALNACGGKGCGFILCGDRWWDISKHEIKEKFPDRGSYESLTEWSW